MEHDFLRIANETLHAYINAAAWWTNLGREYIDSLVYMSEWPIRTEWDNIKIILYGVVVALLLSVGWNSWKARRGLLLFNACR